ncbi:hypothetical protein [Hymenobacter sp.]|uniref:hypothetical protein n=1 Tax=Hymenobacter sp. TaxID=1898978 RepID=UPI002EDBAA33
MKLSYRLLIILLLVGMGLVLMAAFFKVQRYPGSDFLILLGLAIQFIAGVLVVWKFANGLKKRE